MKNNIFLLILLTVFIVGCDAKTPTEQAPSRGKMEDFYKPKSSKVLTYDETVKKLEYEDCLASKNKGECHEPEFLKK